MKYVGLVVITQYRDHRDLCAFDTSADVGIFLDGPEIDWKVTRTPTSISGLGYVLVWLTTTACRTCYIKVSCRVHHLAFFVNSAIAAFEIKVVECVNWQMSQILKGDFPCHRDQLYGVDFVMVDVSAHVDVICQFSYVYIYTYYDLSTSSYS